MKIIVVLNNIRSVYNVGAILRTAEGFGVDKVILSGYTPKIHDASLLPHIRQKIDNQIHKTALGAEDLLSIDLAEDILLKLNELKKDGWQIVGLENNIQNKDLVSLSSPDLKDLISEKVVLVLGEEVDGIDKSLYEMIDLFLEIPMKGQKESFNVSVAAGIAIYGIINL